MTRQSSTLFFRMGAVCVVLAVAWQARDWRSAGQEKSGAAPVAETNPDEMLFADRVQPLLTKYCLRCHNADNMKSGIRLDQLNGRPEDRQLFLWKDILKQVSSGVMPPEDEPQPSEEQRKLLTEWIARTMTAAMARNTERNGSVRRLTVSQYRNTLRDLLGLDEDLTEVLPPDGISKDGFANNGQAMVLSPLQVEAYFDIAEKALDLCIVDEKARPRIQNFRMDLGQGINPEPCPDNLVLGANSLLLNNADFQVTQLAPAKPFAYDPFFMRTKFDFIEGYVGNDTIRAWKKFDSIYHSVFACLRGSPGYPKGQAFQAVPGGLLLRPAIPSAEIFGQSDTYGPMANFKISLRELPDRGNFQISVRAARYDDGLLLEPGTPIAEKTGAVSISIGDLAATPVKSVTIPEPGIYQVDVSRAAGSPKGMLSLELGDRHFAGQFPDVPQKASPPEGEAAEIATAFLAVRLSPGDLKVAARLGDNAGLRRIELTRVGETSEVGRRFQSFEQRQPSVGVHLGLRRDCGSTLSRVGEPQSVSSGALREYIFSGPINDFPSPDVEQDNVNYLAGIREIGVRSEYTDGRDMPRLLIRSIEFEGPFYTEWPPATHRHIFIDSERKHDPATYAGQIIRTFATRAFRRPVTDAEQSSVFAVWQESFAARRDFRQSIKDALLVVLTSPQFLFLIENSAGPEPEDLDPYELAAKLAYFLWNAPPDGPLRDLAAKNALRASLDSEIARLIRDPRFGQSMSEFASQWLSLDKFDVVAVDAKRFPRLTRDAKAQLRLEPVRFVQHLIEQNLPLRNLVQSDFVVANEVVANYYNLGDHSDSGFRFVPIKHDDDHLGGVLTQAGILSGLSDGRESNPVKRGAWLARKLIAEPPDDPPPNVPRLKEDDGSKLTLRQKLELHRNQEGCVKCHAGIDPWGLPLEQYDAGGLFKRESVDARSRLPDGTEIRDVKSLKAYLADDRIDQVAFSFLKHIACYALGRSLTYNELVFLQTEGLKLRADGYRMQDLIRFVVQSDMFLKK